MERLSNHINLIILQPKQLSNGETIKYFPESFQYSVYYVKIMKFTIYSKLPGEKDLISEKCKVKYAESKIRILQQQIISKYRYNPYHPIGKKYIKSLFPNDEKFITADKKEHELLLDSQN